MTFSQKLKTSIFALSIGFACASLPAQAGFQWIPQEKKAPAAQPSPVPDVQQQNLQAPATAPKNIQPQATAPNSAPISVVPQNVEQNSEAAAVQAAPLPLPTRHAPPPAATSAPAKAQPAPVAMTPKSGGLTINPFPKNSAGYKAQTASAPAPAKTPSASTPMVKAAPPVQSGDFTMASGFGTDIPLALALRQVVPPAYAYSFTGDVNPGYRVSWEGGKPWNEVVNNMLAPLQLEAQITGKTIVIRKATGASPKPMAEKAAVQQGQNAPAANTMTPMPASANKDTLRVTEPMTIPVSNFQSQTWEAWRGDDLKTTLNAWSKQVGADIQWQANREYSLNKSVNVNAPFDQAVQKLANEGFRADTRPSISVQNNGKTIVVSDQTA